MISSRILVVAALLTFAVVNAGYTEEDAQLHKKYKKICAKLLQTPAEDLENYLRGEYSETHNTYCFGRCVSILHGIYDDETGPDLAKIFAKIGDGKTEQEFNEIAQTCFLKQEEGAEKPCYCWKAFTEVKCIHEKLMGQKKHVE